MAAEESEAVEAEAPRLTPQDAAEILGVDADTVSRWAAKGALPYFLTPGGHRRFKRSDVLRFLDQRTHGEVPA